MNKHIAGTTTAVAALLSMAGSAQAAQIILSESAVIGSTGGFDSRFTPGNILDRQTGAISEVFAGGEYWLNPDGRKPAFITIDLGAAYQIGSFDVFNSRNLGDRATADFEILAANTTTAASGTDATGLTLGSDAVKLVSGTLSLDASASSIAAQSFAALINGQSYRYLQFRPLTAISTSYGGAAYGLNELRIFDYEAPAAAVPEPASWAMMIGGFAIVGAAKRKRRRGQAFA